MAADQYSDVVMADSPSAYWRLSDGTGAQVDFSGHYTTGLTNANATDTTGLLTRLSDHALTFNGSSAKLKASTTPPTTLSAPYSVEVWFKPNGSAANQELFSTRASLSGFPDLTFDLQVTPSTGFHADVGNGGSWISTSADAASVLTLGNTYHVVYVVTSTGYTAYLNGSSIGSGSWVSSAPRLWDSNHVPAIGFDGSGQQWFNGVIDEVAVYGSALGQPQVQAHYKAGTGIRQAAAALSAAGVLSPASLVKVLGAAGESAAFDLAATAAAAKTPGSAALGAAGALTATGAISTFVHGDAALTAVSTLTSNGLVKVRATSGLSAVGALTALGALKITGSAVMAAVASLVANGGIKLSGSAALAAHSDVACRARDNTIANVNIRPLLIEQRRRYRARR